MPLRTEEDINKKAYHGCIYASQNAFSQQFHFQVFVTPYNMFVVPDRKQTRMSFTPQERKKKPTTHIYAALNCGPERN